MYGNNCLTVFQFFVKVIFFKYNVAILSILDNVTNMSNPLKKDGVSITILDRQIDMLLCRSDNMADNNYDSNMLSPISLILCNSKITL